MFSTHIGIILTRKKILPWKRQPRKQLSSLLEGAPIFFRGHADSTLITPWYDEKRGSSFYAPLCCALFRHLPEVGSFQRPGIQLFKFSSRQISMTLDANLRTPPLSLIKPSYFEAMNECAPCSLLLKPDRSKWACIYTITPSCSGWVLCMFINPFIPHHTRMIAS